jgi:D-alanine-D-alanine ligase
LRKTIAVLFGGRSGEHEISVRSAGSVVQGLSVVHDVLPVLVDKRGGWKLQPNFSRWPLSRRPGRLREGGTPVFLVPSPSDRGVLRRLEDGTVIARPDVYFPVLHGTFGEDGTIQGLFELAGVPFVGSGCAASAVGMDKAFMKGVFASVGLAQAKYRVILHYQREQVREVVEPLGLPLFVKPANLGSSVGVSKVKRWEELDEAVDLAFEYDRKIVVEEGLDAREIELGILGNEEPEPSVVGEIIPDREFYDYDSKYSAESRTELRIPAPLSATEAREAGSWACACSRPWTRAATRGSIY